jgi:hypothetical protein
VPNLDEISEKQLASEGKSVNKDENEEESLQEESKHDSVCAERSNEEDI